MTDKNSRGYKNDEEKDVEATKKQSPIRWRKDAEKLRARRAGKTRSFVLSNAESFEAIVYQNTHFVDKTEFAVVIAAEIRNIGFFFPRRFCKSILLSMTHFLLNKEVDTDSGLPLADQWGPEDSARRLFQKKFAHAKILVPESYGYNFEQILLGSRVCVHISLRIPRPDTYEEFKALMRTLFSNLYEQYRWLLKSPALSRNIDRQKFECFLEEQPSAHLAYALSFLAERLHAHFRGLPNKDSEKVLLLIDDFDYVLSPRLRTSIPQKDLDSINRFFEGMMDVILHNKFIQTVVAGYYPLKKCGELRPFTVLDAAEYASYFGFNDQDFEYLADQFGVTPKDRIVARYWYNGYTIYGLNGETFRAFNPQNVIEFLSERRQNSTAPFNPTHLSAQLGEKFDISKLAQLFLKKSVVSRVDALLEKDSTVDMYVTWPFFSSDISTLKDVARDINDDCEASVVNLFFTLLIYSGYVDAVKMVEPSKYTVTVPNELHRQELRQRVVGYYKMVFKEFIAYVPDAQSALERAYAYAGVSTTRVDEDELAKRLEEFRRSLQVVVEKLPEMRDIRDALPSTSAQALHPNEDIFHSIFNFMALALRGTNLFGSEVYCRCEKGYYTEVVVGKVRSDTSFADFRHKLAVQVEHKFGDGKAQNAATALQQAANYLDIYKAHLKIDCLERVLFVGLTFNKQHQVDLKHFLYEKGDPTADTALAAIQDGPKGTRQQPHRKARDGKEKKK